MSTGDEPVIDMGYLSLPAETQEALEYRAGLRRRIDAALQDSVNRCARCKVCDYQTDAVMAVLDTTEYRLPA